MTDMMKTLRESLPSASDVLHQVGLEKTHPATSVLATVTTFTLGAMTGAALALLFTPRTGRVIRQSLRERLYAARDRIVAPMEVDRGDHADSNGAERPRVIV